MQQQQEQDEYEQYLLSTDPAYLTWSERLDRESLEYIMANDDRQQPKEQRHAVNS